MKWMRDVGRVVASVSMIFGLICLVAVTAAQVTP